MFSNCIVNEDKVTGVTTYFGRPWQGAPKTVFLNTKLLAKVYASGWYYKMGAIPVIFADYNSMDGNGNPVDMSQRISNYEYDVKDGLGNVTSTVTGTAKNSLTDAEAATYTYENVVLRPGSGWDPRMIAEAPAKPINVHSDNGALVWDSVPYTRLYIVFRDNKVLGFTLNKQFTDTTGVAGTTYNYTVQAVSEYGALSLMSDVVQILPLTGLSLTGKLTSGHVALEWKTVTETNTSHFVVERSSGNNFTTIGKTKAAGNSNRQTIYSFTDANPLYGYNVYRIKAVDLDGKFEYSNLVAVQTTNAIALKVYPAMASNTLQVVYPAIQKARSLQLYSNNGQLIRNIPISGNSTITTVDVATLTPGVYFISLKTDQQALQTRFVKQ